MESGVNVYVIGGKRGQGVDKIIERKEKEKENTDLLRVVGIRPRLSKRIPLVVLCVRVRARVARRGRLQWDGRDLQLGRRPPAKQARRARAVRAQARGRAHRHMAVAMAMALAVVLATLVPSPAAAVPAPVLALIVVVLRVEVQVRHVRGRRERAEARRV